MTADGGSVESILSVAGITVAAAVVMLVVFALSRSAGSASLTIALHSAAAEVCGDIGTVAASAVPYNHSEACIAQGVSIRITSDYVVASAGPGVEFARPLAVRVYPGNYCGPDGSCWNDTGDMRSYFNATFGCPGTRESPFGPENGSRVTGLLDEAGREMGRSPLIVDFSLPLTMEKLFLYTYNNSSNTMECEPYVFVCQR